MASRIFQTGVILFTFSSLLGCQSLPDNPSQQQAAATASGSHDANKLLIVDCLLPGQVRQLGSALTYLTPRRPIKTTAQDCEIRGGEYASYDRADYRTALQVWLATAKQGDAESEVNVGEIFEKGLGTEPLVRSCLSGQSLGRLAMPAAHWPEFE